MKVSVGNQGRKNLPKPPLIAPLIKGGLSQASGARMHFPPFSKGRPGGISPAKTSTCVFIELATLAAILVATLFFFSPIPTHAQTDARTFSEVAEEIRQDLEAARSEVAETEADIQRQRAAVEAAAAELRNRLEAERAALAYARERMAAARAARDEKAGAVREGDGDLASLEALMRETAGDWLSLFRQSPFSAEAPERLAELERIHEQKGFRFGDLTALLELGFSDIAEGARIVRREGEIVGRDGSPVSAEILRLGHLAAIYRGENGIGYLLPGADGSRLLASGKPSVWVRRNLNQAMESNLAEAKVAAYLDITGGGAVRQLARDSDLWERVREGGFLIWPILLVGVVSFLLTIERIIFLGRVRQNTDHLMTRVTAMVDDGNFDGAVAATDSQTGRPTANVLRAGLSQRNQPRDIVESRLNEAILREMPRLERFLPALKVLAAIAPLLGLLGTVTGMINTFQVITVHGTGDPRLMAGGISEALITTQLGLAVAIPILVISALLGRRAQTIAADMEEKAMALMAALLRNHLQNGLETVREAAP